MNIEQLIDKYHELDDLCERTVRILEIFGIPIGTHTKKESVAFTDGDFLIEPTMIYKGHYCVYISDNRKKET